MKTKMILATPTTGLAHHARGTAIYRARNRSGNTSRDPNKTYILFTTHPRYTLGIFGRAAEFLSVKFLPHWRVSRRFRILSEL